MNAASTRRLDGDGICTLHPGDVVCAERGARLQTLLGSCVTIILTDPRRTVAAMCHIVHSRPALNTSAESGVFADVALDAMYALLRERGINPTMCDAYVFGGGNMFPNLMTFPHVGATNARWVDDALAADGIRIVHRDVGGSSYRRLSWTVGPSAPVVTAVPV